VDAMNFFMLFLTQKAEKLRGIIPGGLVIKARNTKIVP
jgi:hypothetical protein